MIPFPPADGTAHMSTAPIGTAALRELRIPFDPPPPISLTPLHTLPRPASGSFRHDDHDDPYGHMLRSPPGSTLSLSRPMSVVSGSDLYGGGAGGRAAFGSSSQAPPAPPAPLGLGDPWIMAQHMAAQQSMVDSAAAQHYMEAAAAAGGGVRASEAATDIPRMGGSDPYQVMGGSLRADTYQVNTGLPPPLLSPPSQLWEGGHTFPPTPSATPEYCGSGAASDRSGPSRLLQQQRVPPPPPAPDTALVLQHAAVAALVAASEAGGGSASALVSSLSFDLPVAAAAAAPPPRAGSLLAPRPAEELQQYTVQHGEDERYDAQHGGDEQYKAPPLTAPAAPSAVVAPAHAAPAPPLAIPAAPEVDGVLSDAAQMDQVPERQTAEGFNFAPPSSRASVTGGGSGGGAVTSGGGEAGVSLVAAGGNAPSVPPHPAATPTLPFGLVMVSSFKPEAEAPVPEPAKAAVVAVVPEEPAVQPRGYVRQPNAADIQEAMQAKLRVLREAQQQRLEAQQQAEEEER